MNTFEVSVLALGALEQELPRLEQAIKTACPTLVPEDINNSIVMALLMCVRRRTDDASIGRALKVLQELEKQGKMPPKKRTPDNVIQFPKKGI